MNPSQTAPNWPTNANRTLIVGRTGSGKSVFGLWLLSSRDFHQQPWIITDYKRDPMIAEIEALGAEIIPRNKEGGFTAPIAPGLYILRPDPREPEAVDDFLYQVWSNTHTGLFFDEGFMVPQKRPFKSLDNILTQGRSMSIPVISCYQRPVDLSQFVTSQADFISVFHCLKKDDRDCIGEYVGQTVAPNGQTLDVHTKLPPHYSLWYEVGKDKLNVLAPSPSPDAILGVFAKRLTPPPERQDTMAAPERIKPRLF